MLKISLILLVLLTASCSNHYTPIKGTTKFIDSPSIGKVNSVEIGTPLLSKAKVETKDGYILKKGISKLANPLHPVNSGFRVELNPDKYYLAESDRNLMIYYPLNSSSSKSFALGVELATPTGFAIDNKYNKTFGFIRNGIKIPVDKLDVEPTKVAFLNDANFKQELIYNGKSGNIIRLMYREFSGDMARPAFSQDLTYDLSESKLIGFRGVRIEVISTTNIRINYRVINGFPDID